MVSKPGTSIVRMNCFGQQRARFREPNDSQPPREEEERAKERRSKRRRI